MDDTKQRFGRGARGVGQHAMIPRITIVVLIGVLCGCASNWNRNGAPPQQFATDRYRCTQESKTPFSAGGTGYYGLGAIIAGGIGAQVTAQRLFDLCMEAAGYTKLAADSQPAQVAAVYPSSAAPPPIAPSAPAPPVGIQAESKYLFSAERVARAHNCAPPAAAMTAKGMGMEQFAVACPDGRTLAINCEMDSCMIIR